MARIPEGEIDRLKEEVSVERLVEAAGVVLKRAGKDVLGRCPFHDDAEASLVVTPAKNLWHCFGSQLGGGPIDSVGIDIGPFFHQHICTVSDLNGQVVCGSITASGPFFGSPASPTGPSNNDVYDPTRCRLAAPASSCVESCIAAKLQGDLPSYDVRAGTRFSTPGAQ